MSSNSVSNHVRDKQIGLPIRGRPILLMTRIITDRIGLHSVLLPLLIVGFFSRRKLGPPVLNETNKETWLSWK